MSDWIKNDDSYFGNAVDTTDINKAHVTNTQDYGITIRRVIEEGEECFEARVRELPDVVEYADSHEEAYELAVDTIETTEATYKILEDSLITKERQ